MSYASDRQTDRHIQTDADECFTPSTVVQCGTPKIYQFIAERTV